MSNAFWGTDGPVVWIEISMWDGSGSEQSVVFWSRFDARHVSYRGALEGRVSKEI